MKALAGFVFAFSNIFVLIGCLVLTFKGFPYAIVSLLGYFVAMTAVATTVGVWINPGKEHKDGFTRVLTTIIGVALLYLGDWIITKGGLASLTLTGDSPASNSSLSLSMISWITGVCASILGTHRNDFKA
jgi:hypothetical protein